MIALLFLAAYGVSALTPFVVTPVANASPVTSQGYSQDQKSDQEDNQDNQQETQSEDVQSQNSGQGDQENQQYGRNNQDNGDANSCEGKCQNNKRQPTSVYAQTPTRKDPCGTENDTYTIPAVEGVQYRVDGQPVAPGTYSTHGDKHIEITARAKQGYILIGRDCWKLDFTNNKQCVIEIKPIAPQEPVVNCGPANDSITLPEQEGVTYSTVWQGNKLVVTATAKKGYTFPDYMKTVSWTFTDAATPCPVEVVVPEDPTVVCGPNNDVVTLPREVNHVTYTQTGWANGENTITAIAADGYYIAGTEGKQTSIEWTLYDDATLCATTVTVPVDPTVVCGANNDVVTVPKSDHVIYTSTGWVNGKNTITATADAGYYIAGTEGVTTQTWTYTDAGTFCGHVLGDTTTTPNVTPTSAPRLENTGNSIILPMLISTGVLGLAVMTVLQNDRRSGRVAKRLQTLFEKIGVQLTQPFVVPTA